MATSSFCRICGNSVNPRRFLVPEMMFGTKETFAYFQCTTCECLQIQDIPDDVSRHYPPRYYSISSGTGIRSRLVSWALDERDTYALSGRGWLGRSFYALSPNPALHHVRTLSVPKDARILDVGSGKGQHLRILACHGYKRLTGIDPYLSSEAVAGPGLNIIKSTLEDFRGEFDFIMLHHSLEHMAGQGPAFAAVERLLASGGVALIRVPCVTSYAWRRYGIHWAGLDAPRHLYLHSIGSLRILAARAGLRIRRMVWDSTAFQFWASDQYERGIPLYSRSSLLTNPLRLVLSFRKLRRMERSAEALNREGRGDQLAFVLEKE